MKNKEGNESMSRGSVESGKERKKKCEGELVHLGLLIVYMEVRLLPSYEGWEIEAPSSGVG